ncbi:putative transporter [Mrakia frigida]|uniref:putative transporter n=1 Tax=Mrakia frigida TaxID=29902 RepID=UPI003FCC1CD3
MKEALNFQGNELNYLDTLFRIGYALFLIPSQIILLKIRPSIWLPSLECAWGICTGLMAVMPSVKGMYALRFLIGVFEASSFPGITCILCSWYTPAELATRLAIFGSSYPAAQIFVGFMQVALHEGMEGHLGIPGWKWLFIFNAMMTIIIAGFGFFLIPDSPGVTRVFWLTKEENELSKRRMTRMNKLAQTPFTWATVKKIFSSWVLWVFMGAYSTLGWSQNSNTWITLWLKAVKNVDGTNRFGISELNAIPIGGYVLQIIAMFAFAWASGRFGGRYGWIVAQQMTLVVGNIILSVWPESFAVKMLGFYILWLNHAAGAIMIAWMSDVCPSPEERAVVIGVACTWLYVVDAFANSTSPSRPRLLVFRI